MACSVGRVTFDAHVSQLRKGLLTMPPDTLDAPESARRGAVLALLHPSADGSGTRIIYTRRQDNLSSHPGQISFPGGRVDPGETSVTAALREANEEIGLRPDSVEVLGRLPVFYIPPSRFWMSAVVAVWHEPHELVPSPAEVAEILHVDTAVLRDETRQRAVPLSAAGATWAWQLDDRHLLWGATAVVTGVLMDLAEPGWSGGRAPDGLGPDREVKPWENTTGTPSTAGSSRPRLGPVDSVTVAPPTNEGPPPGDPSPARRAKWASGVAEAVVRLRTQLVARRPDGPPLGHTLVLCGPGTIGAVGRDAAALLVEQGEDVVVVDTTAQPALSGLEQAAVIVDAMVGRGLRGRLADPILGVVRALRNVSAPIVAVDLPSGIDPTHGLVGETVSADVTVTDPVLVPGHVAGGALPFVADLYVVTDAAGLRRADVASRPAEWGE